jgi:leucine-rich repeat protein SHOC2
METSNLNYKIERGAFSRISELNFYHDCLTSLPSSIGSLVDLTKLYINYNQLSSLPESIGNLANLTILHISHNQLTSLPESMGNLSGLTELHLDNNQLDSLPESMDSLSNLIRLNLNGNPLSDLSMLQGLANLKVVVFANVNLPRQYWTKFSEWKPQWLLSEDNAEIRRILIERVGYEKICADLDAVTIDIWREYSLLKIDRSRSGLFYFQNFMGLNEREPLILLKMTCPSTQHIHILRVPPEMVSAEAAITWINHGIHPDLFAVQT